MAEATSCYFSFSTLKKECNYIKGENFEYSFLYPAAVVVTGEAVQFLEFVSRYPYVIWNILTFGAASAMGQVITILQICCQFED